MDQKYNKWLIILGVIFTLLFFLPGPTSIFPFLFLGLFAFLFGILNYTKWATWIKITLSIVLTLIFGMIISYLALTNSSWGWSGFA